MQEATTEQLASKLALASLGAPWRRHRRGLGSARGACNDITRCWAGFGERDSERVAQMGSSMLG
ncbi:unnamed protein product [Ilex paraguariensis]|uniref:Uncharacterized protein n=1 Tax=Ilex paraguariensis TaxID=185542 RepID=A0ABC8UUB5_9AQUA